LLQIYYSIPTVVRAILTADIKIEEEKKSDEKNGGAAASG
jgi:hypothetical protein